MNHFKRFEFKKLKGLGFEYNCLGSTCFDAQSLGGFGSVVGLGTRRYYIRPPFSCRATLVIGCLIYSFAVNRPFVQQALHLRG